MTRTFVSRLLQLVPLLFVISVLVFLISQMIPGDPVSNALRLQISGKALEDIKATYGLQKPVLTQYFDWLRGFLSGDWGQSIVLKTSVYGVLSKAFVNTLILTGSAVVICLVFGVLVGLVSGLRAGSAVDRVTMAIIQIGNNLPIFWFGLFLIWVFGVNLKWFPIAGMYNARGDRGLLDLLHHLVLPSLAAAIISMLILARLVRSNVIDIMNTDYIRTFRSQGFSRAHIIRRHVGRNLAAPVVNMTGLQIGYLLSGVIFVENVFNWPGVGTQIYNAVAGQDYPMIQASVMLITICFVLVNLFTDLIVDWLNPRLTE